MRYIILICVIGILGCQNKKESKSNPNDPCASFALLNGQYKHDFNQGVVTWEGYLNGTIEFAGADYNDMICTYSITDCENGTINMTCDGAPFATQVIIQASDTIMLNSNRYIRL